MEDLDATMASFFCSFPTFRNGNDKENVPVPTATPVAQNPVVSAVTETSKTVSNTDKDTDKIDDDDGSVSTTDKLIKETFAASGAKRSSQRSSFSSSDDETSDDGFLEEDVLLANLGRATMTPNDCLLYTSPSPRD